MGEFFKSLKGLLAVEICNLARGESTDYAMETEILKP